MSLYPPEEDGTIPADWRECESCFQSPLGLCRYHLALRTVEQSPPEKLVSGYGPGDDDDDDE